jgi:hypothetical protein
VELSTAGASICGCSRKKIGRERMVGEENGWWRMREIRMWGQNDTDGRSGVSDF